MSLGYTGAVSGRSAHAWTQRDGKMRKVVADTLSFGEGLQCGARRLRQHTVETDLALHEIADRLGRVAIREPRSRKGAMHPLIEGLCRNTACPAETRASRKEDPEPHAAARQA